MPLPQNVAEQTRWEPSHIPGWSGRLIMFSATVFLVSIMSYVGLKFPYKQSLEKRETEVNNKVKAQNQKISISRQEEIVTFYSQINNVQKLLSSHVLSSRLFSLLEEKTLPTVSYSRFAFTSATNEVKITGVTKVFEDVNKQARAFSGDERVSKALLGNVSSDALRNWNFELTLTLAPGFISGSSSLPVAPDVSPAPSQPSTTSTTSSTTQ